VARALIVGCGCRGRSLGVSLAEAGWAVRGTSRDRERLEPISAAGLEPAVGDPSDPATILELIDDVAVVHLLLGSADGGGELVAAIHGPRLEALLARLVDTPVRGLVYESAGNVAAEVLDQGASLVTEAGERWQIPFEIVGADPSDHDPWREAMVRATANVIGD
jgi:uncharacterized protein YbjT (DUF2867 family)